MSDAPIPALDELPSEVLDRIDRACDRFEASWAAGERPRLEAYLGEFAGPSRAALLRDLLAAEIAARRRRAETPVPAEYRLRFPLDAFAVDSAFGQAATTTDRATPRGGGGPSTDPERPDGDGTGNPPAPGAVPG